MIKAHPVRIASLPTMSYIPPDVDKIRRITGAVIILYSSQFHLTITTLTIELVSALGKCAPTAADVTLARHIMQSAEHVHITCIAVLDSAVGLFSNSERTRCPYDAPVRAWVDGELCVRSTNFGRVWKHEFESALVFPARGSAFDSSLSVVWMILLARTAFTAVWIDLFGDGSICDAGMDGPGWTALFSVCVLVCKV